MVAKAAGAPAAPPPNRPGSSSAPGGGGPPPEGPHRAPSESSPPGDARPAIARGASDYLLIGGTTLAAATLGTYAGAHIGMDQVVQVGLEAGRQAPAAVGWLVGLAEGMRALATHYLPWAVGMGTASGGLGAAVGFALTDRDGGGTVGAPLGPPKEST